MGIHLYFNISNISISGNTVNNNNRGGIKSRSGINLNISDNIVNNNNWQRIYIVANNSIISRNIIENSGSTGFATSDNCFHNIISHNNITESGLEGLYLLGSNNSINKNKISSNRNEGMNIYWCHNNNITSNIIINNKKDGISLFGSNGQSYNNTFFRNVIKNNTNIGLGIWGTSGWNLVYNNIFIGNAINAFDNGTYNQWDNGSLGNYWSDYAGIDSNGDGIGDTPYYINGTAKSQDNFPIWELGDELPPEIFINSPAINQVFGFNAPDFNITIDDQSPINMTWYTIDGRQTNFTFFALTGTINQTAWDNQESESLTLSFYANDTMGNLGFKEVSIEKDIIVPSIVINSPESGETFGKQAPNFNISIIEANLASTWYTIEGIAATFPFSGLNGSINQDAWDDAPEGEITITFYAIDEAGNIGSESVIVIKSIPSEPEVIPGYNLLFLLGIISVASIIISSKIKKSWRK